MFNAIEGIYRNGKIELTEVPKEVSDETPVIVTFLKSTHIDLREHGIGEKQAADLRGRLSTFAEEWDSTEMDAYDNYDESKTNT